MTKQDLTKLSKYFDVDFAERLTPLKIKKNPLRDLLIADTHKPFDNKNCYNTTINDNLDCENLIIDGDWFDFYSKNHYRKTMSIDFKSEFREGFIDLREAARKFKRVYFLVANHDNRYKKWLFDNTPVEMIDLVNYNLVEDLISTIPNLKIIQQKSSTGRDINYIYKFKNIVFSHIEQSGADVSKAVQEIEKKLPKWNTTYNLGNYEALFQAHNHTSAKIRFGDKYLFQIPCLIDINAKAFDYVFSGKLQGNPPALGYTILIKDKSGNFDPAKSYIVDLN